MAARRVGLRGRSIVAIVLAAFLLVATTVVWRRSEGTAAARRLATLDARRAELAAQRAQLEGELQRAASQERLMPVVMRLGLRVPEADQVIQLPRPDARER